MIRIQFTDSLHGIIFQVPYSGQGTLYKTVDGGLSWQDITPTFNFNSAYFTDSIHGWLAGDGIIAGNAGIFYTSDGGITYQQQSNKSVTMITYIDSIHGYCEGSEIFLKTNQTGIINNINPVSAHENE
jgi:photosystem II stability/assembly factor-like uncharacterized protein